MNASQPRKVLVIDDEPEVVDLIREILRAHEYEAIATTQWTDAIDALAHEQPDLMLMDLNMPTIDGSVLLKFVREQGYDVPVMVVSGFISEAVREKLDPFQVCSYVEKPFEVQDLANEIATALAETDVERLRTGVEVDQTAEEHDLPADDLSAAEPKTIAGYKVPPPVPEVPVDTRVPGVLTPRRENRSHRSRKPMAPLKAPLLNRIFRRRIAHFFLIAFICLLLAGFVVLLSERSTEVSGQYKNPPVVVR